MAATAARLRDLMVMVAGLQLSVVGAFVGQLSLVLGGAGITACAFAYEISRSFGFR